MQSRSRQCRNRDRGRFCLEVKERRQKGCWSWYWERTFRMLPRETRRGRQVQTGSVVMRSWPCWQGGNNRGDFGRLSSLLSAKKPQSGLARLSSKTCHVV